ncbi:MAG: hypothetical protein IT174_10685 [Acidobacteria bacterium]|nr:hypothetical protein [Acidobacteriota bacterium]
MPAAYGQSEQQPTNSASGSAKSDIRASEEVQRKDAETQSRIVNACAAAVDELKKIRAFADVLERENILLRERLDTEKAAVKVLTELNETRRSEAEALRTAVAAKNETIAAKDAVIARQDELVGVLKKKKSSPWKRVGDVLIGVAVAAILK